MNEYETQPIGDQYEQLVAEYDALRMHCNDLTTERDRSLAELAALRARVADLEQQVAAHERSIKDLDYLLGLAKAHALEEVAQRDVAYAANATLAQQVAALADALGHAVHRDHAPSAGCDGCLGIDAALRAAGRKT